MNEIICRDGLSFRLPHLHNNIRTVDAIKKLFDNLSRVPIEKIEELTKNLD